MKTRRKKTDPVTEETFTVVDIDDFETVCRVCDAEFLDEEDLKLHIAQVHLNEVTGKAICKVCCAVLSGAEAFVSHFIFKHLESSLFCFYCYRAFTDPLVLDRHESKHCAMADNSSLTCSQCPSIFTDRQQLQKHEFSEHHNSNDGFMLNSYFSLLSSALNLKIKKFLDCVCKKKPLICHRCNYSGLTVNDFIEHLKISRCQSLACDKCFNVYKKKYSVMNHMRKKPQCQNFVTEKDIQVSCPKCEKHFDLTDIKNHKICCKVIKCSTCKKLFNSIYELTDHRIEEHQVSISLEICKFCKKEFIGKLSLKKHMNRSHKDKSLYKYNCVYCQSLFTHPKNLFAHFFTRHKDIEPYTCKICNKCFRLRKHFTIHIKLQHKSVGYVEFDKNLHVIFTDKKSEKPVEAQANVSIDSTTASESDDIDDKLYSNKKDTDQFENKELDSALAKLEDGNVACTTQSNRLPDNISSGDLKDYSDETKTVRTIKIEIERLDKPKKVKRKRRQRIVRATRKRIESIESPVQLSDDSEEEPLSKIKKSLSRDDTQNIPYLERRMVIRDRKSKLTCKICKKYCYTVQNYHHHLTLHERTKMKRCIKCNEYFRSRMELKDHIDSTHASSKLIETLKSVLEKRKKIQPDQQVSGSPGESMKNLLEKRKKEQIMSIQNSVTNRFRRTIQKVDVTDDCTATLTPVSDHGLSVKNFIENFRPEGDNVNISNSVTIKAVDTPIVKESTIKLRKFNSEPPPSTDQKLSFPVKFKDPPVDFMNTKVNVKLVQQLITKPKSVNMTYNERVPLIPEQETDHQYCNMFADETDYTEYRNDIPEVAHEVMLGDPEDIPRTKRLAQEIIIPKIPEEHGGVRIGHLHPQAPFYKIVKVKKLLKSINEPKPEETPTDTDVKLPDGTRLISVKNPYSHLIPNEHLEEILKANRTKYYTPKAKNIEKAIAKALNQMNSPRERRGRKKIKQT